MASTRATFRLPRLPRPPELAAPVAAAVVGLVCGAVAVGLVRTVDRGCDGATGTAACGGIGPLPLTVIIVVTFVLGLLLLRMLAVADAGLVVFFGVALSLVVVTLLLIDLVFSGWMALILPAVTASCFLGGSVFTRAAAHGGSRLTEVEATGAPDTAVDDAPSTAAAAPTGDGEDDETVDPDAPHDATRNDPTAVERASDETDAETQPLVVSERIPDETTMLTALDGPSPDDEQDPAHPDSDAADGKVEGDDTPSAEDEVGPAADRPGDIGAAASQRSDRPSPWKRA